MVRYQFWFMCQIADPKFVGMVRYQFCFMCQIANPKIRWYGTLSILFHVPNSQP